MIDIDLTTLTLAALLTTAGAGVLAVIVTGLVSVIGRLFVITGNEARLVAFLAAVFTGLLATQAVISGEMPLGVPLILAVVIGWYGVTRLSMSLYDDATSQPGSLRRQL
jgi:hypothetical protein